jgi:hypothetical protein
VVTRADLVRMVAPTYAAAMAVDEEEAHERLARALERPGVADDLYQGLSAGLRAALASRLRTTDDELVDKLSRGVQARAGRVKAAPDHPAIAAVMVRLNLELGLAGEPLRATLETPRGRAVLEQGLALLGGHIVKALLK